jgi:hypothetical protein
VPRNPVISHHTRRFGSLHFAPAGYVFTTRFTIQRKADNHSLTLTVGHARQLTPRLCTKTVLALRAYACGENDELRSGCQFAVATWVDDCNFQPRDSHRQKRHLINPSCFGKALGLSIGPQWPIDLNQRRNRPRRISQSTAEPGRLDDFLNGATDLIVHF